MEILKKIKNYNHFKKVKEHHDLLLKIAKKSPNSYGLGVAFVGIAYEYLLMDLNSELDKTLPLIPARIFNDALIEDFKKDSTLMVVVFVLLDYIKELPDYKENFFFKIFLENLKKDQIPLPDNPELLIPKFLISYKNIYNGYLISLKN